jgi:hypothetical protein
MIIASALCPRINEVPDRVKTALLQFLGVTVPFCEEYFAHSINTLAFLNRLSNILGAQGTKPSAALSAAGRLLVELVYKVAPKVVYAQICLLNGSQQTLIKNLLIPVCPDINSLVSAAGKLKLKPQKPLVRDEAIIEEDGLCKDISEYLLTSQQSNITPPMPIPKFHSHTGDLQFGGGISPPESAYAEGRGITWILAALSSNFTDELIEGGKELKALAKQPENKDSFWPQYCDQIICLLLEAFHSKITSAIHPGTPNRQLGSLPLTGYSPNVCEATSLKSFIIGNELPPHTESKNRLVSPSERMLISAKVMLAIARYKGQHINSCREILISRLCASAAFVPVAVTLHTKQVISALCNHDAIGLFSLVLGFVNYEGYGQEDQAAIDRVRLLALQVLAESVKHLSGSLLQAELGNLCLAIMPSLESTLVGKAINSSQYKLCMLPLFGSTPYRYAEGSDIFTSGGIHNCWR